MPIAAIPSRSTRETIPFFCCLWTIFSPHSPYLPEKMTAEYVHQSLFPLTHRCQRAIITLTRSDRQQSSKTGRDFFLNPENNNTNLAALVPLLHTHLRKVLVLVLVLDPGSKSFQKRKPRKESRNQNS
jgi:hypothetical protein